MTNQQQLILALADAWGRVERRLDGSLSTIKGISFSEYRMLAVIAAAPNAQASRVDIADAVGRTPSGVTRSLRPLEKLGFVETHKSPRDARLALAALTPQGKELISDAIAVVDEVCAEVVDALSTSTEPRQRLEKALQLLATR